MYVPICSSLPATFYLYMPCLPTHHVTLKKQNKLHVQSHVGSRAKQQCKDLGLCKVHVPNCVLLVQRIPIRACFSIILHH